MDRSFFFCFVSPTLFVSSLFPKTTFWRFAVCLAITKLQISRAVLVVELFRFFLLLSRE